MCRNQCLRRDIIWFIHQQKRSMQLSVSRSAGPGGVVRSATLGQNNHESTNACFWLRLSNCYLSRNENMAATHTKIGKKSEINVLTQKARRRFVDSMSLQSICTSGGCSESLTSTSGALGFFTLKLIMERRIGAAGSVGAALLVTRRFHIMMSSRQ